MLDWTPALCLSSCRLIIVVKETDDKAMCLFNTGKVTYKVTFPWMYQELVANNFLPLDSQTYSD